VLLFGGVADPQQGWLWNGQTWSQAGALPLSLTGMGACVGSLGGGLVVAGGDAMGTWLWNGTQWSNPATSAMSPPSRLWSAVATMNGKVLLFGGCQSCGGNFGLMGDTWQWDGQSWTELHPSQSPPARFGAVSGTVAGKIVVFGGESYGGEPYFGDTWEWDGKDWSKASPTTSPSARLGASAAVADGKLLMFGGFTGPLEPQGDTWSWDGTSWTELTPASSPPARADAQMGSLRDTPVLFGGADAQGNVLGDTWTWNGTSWIAVPGAMGTANSLASMGCY
jgi:N-acetylneuraminic acid mutarotase